MGGSKVEGSDLTAWDEQAVILRPLTLANTGWVRTKAWRLSYFDWLGPARQLFNSGDFAIDSLEHYRHLSIRRCVDNLRLGDYPENSICNALHVFEYAKDLYAKEIFPVLASQTHHVPLHWHWATWMQGVDGLKLGFVFGS